MKTKWKPGPPTTKGLFWYDAGLWFKDEKNKYPYVATSWMFEGELHTHVYADCGSSPLSFIYNKDTFKKNNLKSRHALINRPRKWVDHKTASKIKFRRAWVKSPEGYIGLGLIRSDWDSFDLDIVWKNHPTDGSVCGSHLCSEDNYLFSPLKEPVI